MQTMYAKLTECDSGKPSDENPCSFSQISSAAGPVMPFRAMPPLGLVATAGHGLGGALVGHDLPQPVGLVAVEPRTHPCQLHELLLEYGHTEGLLQDGLGECMGGADGLFARAAPQVRMDRLALDRPGADERHVDHEVLEGEQEVGRRF
jgi:hypothetical protein